jgi:predicted transcriptional regulator of viral defense system
MKHRPRPTPPPMMMYQPIAFHGYLMPTCLFIKWAQAHKQFTKQDVLKWSSDVDFLPALLTLKSLIKKGVIEVVSDGVYKMKEVLNAKVPAG